MDIKEASELQKSKKVVELHPNTEQDIDPDKVLASIYGKLDEVVIAGVDKEGNYFFASSSNDGRSVLWLIEKLKMKLLTEMCI